MNGSIRRRGKNSWELTVDLGHDSNGKRRRKFVNVRGKKADAERRLRELITQVEGGVSLDSSKVTVAEFLERWLFDYAETNTSPRTVQGYHGVVQRYLVPKFGTLALAKLTPQHVQGLYSDMLGRGLSAMTTLHAHRVLREALSHAVKWGLLGRNVCDAVDPPRPRKKEMASLDAPDIQRFLDTASSSTYGPVFFLALYTGMRRSELLGLKWSRVDVESKTISVTQTLQRIRGRGLVVMEPKTDRSRRLVSLPPSAVALLRGLRAKQREDSQSLGLDSHNVGFVFARPDGSPIDPDAVTHAFTRIVKTLGLSHVRFHDLRHTHASMMLKQGVHPKIVSERLGHSSVVITLDTYSHVLPGLQDEAALKFEEGLQQEARQDLSAQGPR